MDTKFKEMGGCGRFNILLVAAVISIEIFSAFTMYLMAFGNYNPGWTCRKELALNSSTPSPQYPASQADLLNVTWGARGTEGSRWSGTCDDLPLCVDMQFLGESLTVVSEWGLVCDKNWIPSLIISLQMAGGFVGTCCCGQLGDRIGRKKVIYGNLALGIATNLLAAFSTSWQMLAGMRFLAGLFVGGIISVVCPYLLEFVDSRHRSCVIAIPGWQIGTTLFAVSSLVLQNWRHIHLLTAAWGCLAFLPVLWVPESLRWLAARGKIQQAEGVARAICKGNRHDVPKLEFITEIAEAERRQRRQASMYTHLTLLRLGALRMNTIIFCIQYFCYAVCIYALHFGVKAMFGSFFINLILLTSSSIPAMVLLPPVANKLGRQRGCLCFLAVSILLAISVVITYFVGPVGIRGTLVNVFALCSILFISLSWSVDQVLLLESFPTVVRSLAYSASIMATRLGSVFAPYVIPKDFDSLYISFSVVTALLSICFLTTLLVKETKNLPMKDSLASDEPVTRDEERECKKDGRGEEVQALKEKGDARGEGVVDGMFDSEGDVRREIVSTL